MRRVGDAGHMVGSRHWFRQWGGLGRLREGGRDRLLPLLRRNEREKGGKFVTGLRNGRENDLSIVCPVILSGCTCL